MPIHHHHRQNSPFEAQPALGNSVRFVLNMIIRSPLLLISSVLRPNLNLEDQMSVFMFPRDRVAQFYPQAPGSLVVAFYGSQGYTLLT
jgi:hypothetical protein